MKIYHNLDEFPALENVVLTIGAYDGVHKGHRSILKRVVGLAREKRGNSVVLTFHPHPRKVVFPNDHSLRLITTLEEKLDLLRVCHVDHVIILPFTVEFSQIDPHDYVQKILIDKIGAKHVIIGYDHRFGLNRQGDYRLLESYEKKGFFKLYEIPEQQIENINISSSKIRNFLANGNIREANSYLGSPFRISGVIERGMKIASGLGFPTANISISEVDKIIPKPGTYAATCVLRGEGHSGMLYIGSSRTLQKGRAQTIEMNIFDRFQDDLYGEIIQIYLWRYIREDQIFPNKKLLLENIGLDRVEAESYFRFDHNRPDSIVTTAILAWNNLPHLKEYLVSHLKASTENHHVLVIDNGSEDKTDRWIQSAYPEVETLVLDKNLGFAGGYNMGLEKVESRYVALVNSDVEVTEGWLDPIINFLEEHPEVAGVQPKIRSFNDRERFEYAGAAGGFIDNLGYPFCRGRLFSTVEKDTGQYDENREVFWTSGAAMVMRTELFVKFGGFDADFFAHQEEIDLCWRLKNAGYSFYVLTNSTVYHVGGGSLDYESPRKTFLNIRNNWWMIMKNEAPSRLFFVLPLRFGLDLIFSLKLFLQGQISHGWNVLRGLVSALFSFGEIRKKRMQIQVQKERFQFGRVNNRGRSSRILPLAYFIGKKKHFSDIDL